MNITAGMKKNAVYFVLQATFLLAFFFFCAAKLIPELQLELKYQAVVLQKCEAFWVFGLMNKK